MITPSKNLWIFTELAQISEKLSALGINNVWQGVNFYSGNQDNMVRTHFAQFLVDNNHATSIKHAFTKYLQRGALAYVPLLCYSLNETVRLIKQAGGVAVIAHPSRYQLNNKQLSYLVSQFQELGGEGIEVYPHQDDIIKICNKYSLLASVGTDFHYDKPRVTVGINPMFSSKVNNILNRLNIEL